MTRNCVECGNSFETKRSHSMYCSQRCRSEAFKKNKALGNADNTLNIPPVLPEISNPVVIKKPEPVKEVKTPHGFDIATQFAFNQQTERIQDLKADLKEKQEEIKKLIAEKDKLKEELIAAQSELNSKPSGLNGFVTSNPSIVEKAMDMFGPKLLGILEKLEPKNADHPVWMWLVSQTPEVQQDFVDLIEGLNKNPGKMRDHLAQFKRGLLALAEPQPTAKSERFGR